MPVRETDMVKAWLLLRITTLLFLAGSVPGRELFAAELRVPNASLEVTVRQRQEGELGRGLHFFHLLCWKGECSLTALSLNQCYPAGSGKPAFFAKIERTSTSEGNLRVTNLGDVLQVQQVNIDIGGESTTTLRFGYAMSGSSAIANRVTGFSGGYVKSSEILKRVTTVEYVPLIGAFHEILLDCAVLLPGVDVRK